MNFKELLKKWNNGIFRGAQTHLAKIIGLDQSTINQWLMGVRLPGEDVQYHVAKELGVTVEELMSSFGKREPLSARGPQIPYGTGQLAQMWEQFVSGMVPAIQITPVPVVGTVSAESFNFAYDNQPEEYLSTPFESKPNRKCATVKVVGNCMEPTVRDGEYAVISETNYTDNGKLVVVRLNNECALKRLYRKDGHVELKPDNPKHKSLRIQSKDFHVVGIIIGSFRKPW